MSEISWTSDRSPYHAAISSLRRIFPSWRRAEKVELQAKSLDLPADSTPRMRDATIFYVDIGLPPGRGAGAMMEKYGEERILLRDKATCPRSN